MCPTAKPHVSTLDPKHCPICAALSCILHSLAPVAPQQKMPVANSSQGTALLRSGCPQPRDPSPSWTLRSTLTHDSCWTLDYPSFSLTS